MTRLDELEAEIDQLRDALLDMVGEFGLNRLAETPELSHRVCDLLDSVTHTQKKDTNDEQDKRRRAGVSDAD